MLDLELALNSTQFINLRKFFSLAMTIVIEARSKNLNEVQKIDFC